MSRAVDRVVAGVFAAALAVPVPAAAAPCPVPQFAMCTACHATAANAPKKMGPSLVGVVGRKAGSTPGYSYSPAMTKAGFAWTPEKLEAFLRSPRAAVPGTKMAYAGQSDAKARAGIIGCLRTLRP